VNNVDTNTKTMNDTRMQVVIHTQYTKSHYAVCPYN